MKIFIFLFLSVSFLFSAEVFVKNKHAFYINNKSVSFIGNKYIVIDLDDGIGHFYAFNKKGSLFLSGIISAGNPEKGNTTPQGVFSILVKKKFHMSSLYPDGDGNNNMNDMLKITNSGIALHKGNVDYYSHGCIHIQPNKSRKLFNWADKSTKIIITNDSFKDYFDSF